MSNQTRTHQVNEVGHLRAPSASRLLCLRCCFTSLILRRHRRETLCGQEKIYGLFEILGLVWPGLEVEAIRTIAKAYQQRSLQDFDAALVAWKAQLVDDPVVHSHLASLYDTLLEQNLCRLIEPFSRVEIAHLAKLIQLPFDTVLTKLSQVCIPISPDCSVLRPTPPPPPSHVHVPFGVCLSLS